MADNYGAGWGTGSLGQPTPQQQPRQPTPEELQAQLQQAQLQLQIQQAKAAQEQARAAEFERKLKEGPELTYNPIEKGADGEIKLRKEFQMEGPEKFIEAERGRLGTEQAAAADELQRQMAQQQAQARSQMASRGGMRGGSQALLQRFSMRDALMGRQSQGREFQRQRGELEAKGYSLGQAIKEKNLQNLMGSVKDVEQFNLRKWEKAKEVEASKMQADATRAAGGGGSKK